MSSLDGKRPYLVIPENGDANCNESERSERQFVPVSMETAREIVDAIQRQRNENRKKHARLLLPLYRPPSDDGAAQPAYHTIEIPGDVLPEIMCLIDGQKQADAGTGS